MPPHCDSMDGPVVTAARQALEQQDVTLVLPYVPRDAEGEVEAAHERVAKARVLGDDVRDLADLWFFETVVRLHRAGEGAPYTGLRPAGLDVGPVVPVAERAIADGDPAPLIDLLTTIVRDETRARFDEMLACRAEADRGGGDAARAYVTSVLALQVWSHRLASTARADVHGEGHDHR